MLLNRVLDVILKTIFVCAQNFAILRRLHEYGCGDVLVELITVW